MNHFEHLLSLGLHLARTARYGNAFTQAEALSAFAAAALAASRAGQPAEAIDAVRYTMALLPPNFAFAPEVCGLADGLGYDQAPGLAFA